MSSDEELFEAPAVKKIVEHFSGPKERSVQELIQYAYEMKQQREEAEKEYELALEKIKSALKVDKIEGKKSIVPADGYDVVVSKRNGQVKFDYDKFIEDEIGGDAVGEIERIKTLAKEGKADSKYIKVGKEVIAVEIVKRATDDLPF